MYHVPMCRSAEDVMCLALFNSPLWNLEPCWWLPISFPRVLIDAAMCDHARLCV